MVQVPAIASGTPAQALATPTQIITKNGYIYIYVSNESAQKVFFDNLTIHHNRGPLLEETHYYPFGLTMAGISDHAILKPENRFKYNGIELNHKEFSDGSSLELYTAQFRGLDPQIGRWWQIDPEAENLEDQSPYESMGNNPVNNEDPFGDFKHKFGAWIYKLFHGSGEIGRNQNGEYYVATTKSGRGKDGIFTVTSTLYYGKGRDQYSAAREKLGEEYKQQQDIDQMTREGIWNPNLTPVQAGRNALSLGVNLLLPNIIIRPVTVAINTEKIAAKVKIIFGNNLNQLYHTFRHIDELGLSRSVVQTAIEEHLSTIASQITESKPLNQVIEVEGRKIQYTAFKLSDGTINVGRIHAAN